MTKDTTYKRFYPILKWALALFSIGYFAFQWRQGSGMDLKLVQQAMSKSAGSLVLLVLLMILNWYLESAKFRLLLKRDIKLARLRAFMTVLSGTTISNFTPAKTGDYIGRTLLLRELPAIRVVVPTVTGNLLQLGMTYLFGLLSILLLLGSMDGAQNQFDVYRILTLAIGMLMLLLAMLLVLRYVSRSRNLQWPSWALKVLSILKQFKQQVVVRVGLYSALRYVVFSMQFFLVLQIFSANDLPFNTLMYIPVIYLLQSLMPVPAVTDIGFRMYFTSMFFEGAMQSSEITHAVMALWLINLIIPGVIGAFYILYSLFAQGDSSHNR